MMTLSSSMSPKQTARKWLIQRELHRFIHAHAQYARRIALRLPRSLSLSLSVPLQLHFIRVESFTWIPNLKAARDEHKKTTNMRVKFELMNTHTHTNLILYLDRESLIKLLLKKFVFFSFAVHSSISRSKLSIESMSIGHYKCIFSWKSESKRIRQFTVGCFLIIQTQKERNAV